MYLNVTLLALHEETAAVKLLSLLKVNPANLSNDEERKSVLELKSSQNVAGVKRVFFCVSQLLVLSFVFSRSLLSLLA